MSLYVIMGRKLLGWINVLTLVAFTGKNEKWGKWIVWQGLGQP